MATGVPAGEARRCVLCGRELAPNAHPIARFDSEGCRTLAHHLRTLLAGEGAGGQDGCWYGSVAERLAAQPKPGSALKRLLEQAGLERRDDPADRT